MKHQDAIAKVRGIVDGHTLPDFILGYDVRLGEFDGDPALWVVFQVKPGSDRLDADVDRRVAHMRALQDGLTPELLAAFDDRFPYFRYQSAAATTAAAGE